MNIEEITRKLNQNNSEARKLCRTQLLLIALLTTLDGVLKHVHNAREFFVFCMSVEKSNNSDDHINKLGNTDRHEH